MGGGTLKLCASAGPAAVTYMGHLVGRSRTHIIRRLCSPVTGLRVGEAAVRLLPASRELTRTTTAQKAYFGSDPGPTERRATAFGLAAVRPARAEFAGARSPDVPTELPRSIVPRNAFVRRSDSLSP